MPVGAGSIHLRTRITLLLLGGNNQSELKLSVTSSTCLRIFGGGTERVLQRQGDQRTPFPRLEAIAEVACPEAHPSRRSGLAVGDSVCLSVHLFLPQCDKLRGRLHLKLRTLCFTFLVSLMLISATQYVTSNILSLVSMPQPAGIHAEDLVGYGTSGAVALYPNTNTVIKFAHSGEGEDDAAPLSEKKRPTNDSQLLIVQRQS